MQDGKGGPIALLARGGEGALPALQVGAVMSVDLSATKAQAGDAHRARLPTRRRPRPATSPAVCRGWRSCSRHGKPKDAGDHRGDRRRGSSFGKDYKNKRRV